MEIDSFQLFRVHRRLHGGDDRPGQEIHLTPELVFLRDDGREDVIATTNPRPISKSADNVVKRTH
jgi:hypothetical protein